MEVSSSDQASSSESPAKSRSTPTRSLQLQAALYLHGDSSCESIKALQTRNSDTRLRASVVCVVTRMSLPSEEFPDGCFPDPNADYHLQFESSADGISDNVVHFIQAASNQGISDKTNLDLNSMDKTLATPISSPAQPILPAAPTKPIGPVPPVGVEVSGNIIAGLQNELSSSYYPSVFSDPSVFHPIPTRSVSSPPDLGPPGPALAY